MMLREEEMELGGGGGNAQGNPVEETYGCTYNNRFTYHCILSFTNFVSPWNIPVCRSCLFFSLIEVVILKKESKIMM
jgi:hypothetical protein